MTLELGSKFACVGYAVFGLDIEGHGRSEGVRCHIPNFDYVIDDYYDYFKSICGKDSILSMFRYTVD